MSGNKQKHLNEDVVLNKLRLSGRSHKAPSCALTLYSVSAGTSREGEAQLSRLRGVSCPNVFGVLGTVKWTNILSFAFNLQKQMQNIFEFHQIKESYRMHDLQFVRNLLVLAESVSSFYRYRKSI
jgi:hypothetical protein